MNEFIAKYQDQLRGTLSGFDRLVFLGTLWRNRITGMKGYLWAHGLGAKDFGRHAEEISKKVKAAALAPMEMAGRPVRYLNSGKLDKQSIAREIAVQDGIAQGPICALTAVELCSSYAIRAGQRGPELQMAPRKCLFVYQYWMHPVFGFLSVRLQTWLPFPIHIYLNGREWLARQMKEAGIGYRRQGNSFPWIEDVDRAQELMNQQQRVHWSGLFDAIAQQIHPLLFSQMCRDYPMRYYWTCSESEWAMDLMFRDPEQLRRMAPRLMRMGILSFSSPDVLRFMGKQVSRQGEPLGRHALALNSDWKVRCNGARIKHRLGPNSIKLYDKAYEPQGALLRAEVTISAPRYFRILRRTEDPNSKPALREMRQSVADLQAFTLTGFRNRDLQGLLYQTTPGDKAEQRRRSAAIGRQLRLLRAHGLIRKLPRSHRYQVSSRGRQILNAFLIAHQVTVEKLLPLAV
ncbi:MAG: hypothetical protein KIT09_18090 [Bryobacteraceae bacterium]|nr:hypothetical protein [Bryobacteraceae bacterium]